MSNLSSMDIIIIVSLVAVIIVLIAVIIVLDIINKKKKNEENIEEIDDSSILEDKGVNTLDEVELSEELPIEVEKEESSVTPIETVQSPTKVEEIKYVETDAELEKTKAKIELRELQKELERQEALNIQTDLAKSVKEDIFDNMEPDHLVEEVVNYDAEQNKETISTEPVQVETKEEVAEPQIVDEQVENVKIQEESQVQGNNNTTLESVALEISDAIEEEKVKNANVEKAVQVQEDLNELLNKSIKDEVLEHEDLQEKSAIISVEELSKKADEVYNTNEEYQMSYEDENEGVISLKELEKLYDTVEAKVNVEQIVEEAKPIINESEIKKLEDLPPISVDKKFKSSPFISPVFGVSETKESLALEQTANLDKLNEEIKKTNEFLNTLKELQKNLD